MKQATLILTLLLLVAVSVVASSNAVSSKVRTTTVSPKIKLRTTKKGPTPAVNKGKKSTVSPKIKLRTTKQKGVTPAVSKMPTSIDVGKVTNGVKEAEKVFNLIKTFTDLTGITAVLPFIDAVPKFFSALLTILGFFSNNGGESAEMKFMRKEFQRVHNTLNAIQLQLDSVKDLIEWTSARAMYAGFEKQIITAGDAFDNYVAAEQGDSKIRGQQFLDAYKPDAAQNLYHGIVETEFVVAQNLAAAAKSYTKDHRRMVMTFLWGMYRLILKGAEMDIAYQKISRTDQAEGERAAKLKEEDWSKRMDALIKKMQEIEQGIVQNWHNQLKADIDRMTGEQHDKSNGDFVAIIMTAIEEKYYWRKWIVIAYEGVSGFDNHALNYVDAVGYHIFRANEGKRNVVVVSSDPNTSTFTEANGNEILAAVQDARPATTKAERWLEEMNNRAGDYNHVALRAAICWGCDVYWRASAGRASYKQLTATFRQPGGRFGGGGTTEKHFNGFLFG